ncbi:intracellular chloride channel [Aureococcus anophagefferens]|nr:intracellular chloride channel [Aureococcus anophagefferens]
MIDAGLVEDDASGECVVLQQGRDLPPILLLLLLAPPGDADRPVLFQHIPGTGGSSLMTALRRYGCARGLSLCPVVGGVRKHGPEDPRWASVAAYDVVASHLPSVDAADAWRLSHPGGRVLTVLRDPVVYAHKHDPGAAPRLDAQYQYLRHGWRRDAAAEPRAEMSPADARAFLRALRPARCGRGASSRTAPPAPNAARRTSAASTRSWSGSAKRGATAPARRCARRSARRRRRRGCARRRGSSTTRTSGFRRTSRFVVAALADYADGDDWARHGATFASRLAAHRRANAHREGGGASCARGSPFQFAANCTAAPD